jgi:hypothetical protein
MTRELRPWHRCVRCGDTATRLVDDCGSTVALCRPCDEARASWLTCVLALGFAALVLGAVAWLGCL